MKKPDHLAKFPEIRLTPEASLRDAVEVITRIQSGIALVVGEDDRLKGIVVDSDIRRALLRGDSLDTPIDRIMNADPFTAPAALSYEELVRLFQRNHKAYVPLVDERGRLVSVAAMVDYLTAARSYPNTVVLMAGGRGERLKPMTDHVPKPMVPVGDKPILEHGLELLAAFGLNRFVISVNYLEGRIREYFGDGARWGVDIRYLNEPRKMGTAGALSLIEEAPDEAVIVMNGDLLTRVNVHALLECHETDGNVATVCVRQYDFEVPFGVVQVDGSRLAGIVEKPVHQFLVNAGIYVLEPEVLSWLAPGEPCEMPDFLEAIRTRAPERVGCFPIQEYWLDIGRPEDYRRALKEYGRDD